MSDKMLEKEYVPFGVEIYVSDIDTSIIFYRDILGFILIREDREHKFASFEFNGSIFMMEQAGIKDSRGKGVLFRFILNDVKSYYELVQSKGAKIIKPLETKFYGLTRFYVEDRDGYQLKFGSK